MLVSDGLIRLKEALPDLTEAERKIARFVLQHPSEFVNLTIQELATRSHGSPTAVVRLWKSLGFSGFQNFKLRVASALQSGAHAEYSELNLGSSFASVVHCVKMTHLQSIQDTLRLLDELSVQKTVAAICQSSRIMVYGAGASVVVATDLAQKLTRLGFPAFISSDFHTAATLAVQFQESDLLILISHSGSTSEVVEIGLMAKKRGTRVVAISRFGETPLSRVADIKLSVSVVEPELRLAATTSRIAALTVVDVLSMSLANQHPNEVYDVLELTRTAVSGHKYKPLGKSE